PRYQRRLDEAGWRVHVDPTTGAVVDPPRTRAEARRADSAERRATRNERALAAFQRIHREVIGDLLDAIRDRDATIERLTRPRPRYARFISSYLPGRYENFDYGHRRTA